MLFSSNVFLFFFLPIALIGYHLLGRFGRRAVFGWLSLVSLFFYGYWNPKFLFLLGGSILINFTASRVIARVQSERAKTITLVCAITANLGLLFWFKYLFPLLHFFHGVGWLSRNFGSVILPLGISFFTFTQISYLVDLAQGQAEVQDFLSYLLFVTFFPHLIAGPILHHKEMMPQFSGGIGRRFSLNPEDFSVGFTWFLLGLAKKVLIADKLAPTADVAFSHAGSLPATAAWAGLVAYTMQLYFDFSGYSDMALGLARMFSIRFPLNFDSPFKATSVTEYWQRWHMTLTRYITLYLYNPILLSVQRRRVLAGKKTSRKALASFGGFTSMVTYPTMVTMLLTGIWHGAGLQFVLFGLIHGVYLTANQAWRHFRQRSHNAPAPSKPLGPTRLAMMIGVYLQIAFALIFFRAPSLDAAFHLLSDLFGHNGAGHPDQLLAGWFAFALFPVVWFFPNTQQILGEETGAGGIAVSPGTPNVNPAPAPTLFPWLRWYPNTAWLLVMAAIAFASLANLDPHARFLYFQF
jgi:D-alanyl-lipoteichoic acid acyltransferase DltB (MBOAT superfamily)